MDKLLTGNEGIIIAADVSTTEALRDLVRLTTAVRGVAAFKIGLSLVIRYGLAQVVRVIRELSDLPIIYDHQKAATDIPATGTAFAKACSRSGIQGAIFFPLSGPKTLESFVRAAYDEDIVPIVGLIMTHSSYLESEGGFIRDDSHLHIARISTDLGVGSFVLPGNRLSMLTDLTRVLSSDERELTLMMPGIGTQGGSIREAFLATKAHRHFAIIGSAIYNAHNPKAALQQFVSDMTP